MRDPKLDEYLLSLDALLKQSRLRHARAAESIRKSEETLRAAKATLNELREKLRRIA